MGGQSVDDAGCAIRRRPLQIRTQLRRGLVPRSRFFSSVLTMMPPVPRACPSELPRRRRVVVQNGDERQRRRGFQKGRPAGHHLVEHHAEREEIVRASSSSPRACSGDMYATVPRQGPDWSAARPQPWGTPKSRYRPAAEDVTLARPKSMILACPREVTKMFAGLISRCTIPRVCAASSASTIWMARSSSSSSFSGPAWMRARQPVRVSTRGSNPG